MKKYFVTGIGTGVGKTIVSAILCEALNADYWKPVQAGIETGSDTNWVKKHVVNSQSYFHPEKYQLPFPVSPHLAAELQGQHLEFSSQDLPSSQNSVMIIEGAGGLLVPINQNQFVKDLPGLFNAEIILVVSDYLGSINHTLLSLAFLKQSGLSVKGLVINGSMRNSSARTIERYSPWPILFRIKKERKVTQNTILRYSQIVPLENFRVGN